MSEKCRYNPQIHGSIIVISISKISGINSSMDSSKVYVNTTKGFYRLFINKRTCFKGKQKQNSKISTSGPILDCDKNKPIVILVGVKTLLMTHGILSSYFHQVPILILTFIILISIVWKNTCECSVLT